jgi:hypothetical protein
VKLFGEVAFAVCRGLGPCHVPALNREPPLSKDIVGATLLQYNTQHKYF